MSSFAFSWTWFFLPLGLYWLLLAMLLHADSRLKSTEKTSTKDERTEDERTEQHTQQPSTQKAIRKDPSYEPDDSPRNKYPYESNYSSESDTEGISEASEGDEPIIFEPPPGPVIAHEQEKKVQ
jgi:hypothetical protein